MSRLLIKVRYLGHGLSSPISTKTDRETMTLKQFILFFISIALSQSSKHNASAPWSTDFHKLEVAMAELQKHAQASDQKMSAVLSSLLSQSTATAVQMKLVKEDIKELQRGLYNLTLEQNQTTLQEIVLQQELLQMHPGDDQTTKQLASSLKNVEADVANIDLRIQDFETELAEFVSMKSDFAKFKESVIVKEYNLTTAINEIWNTDDNQNQQGQAQYGFQVELRFENTDLQSKEVLNFDDLRYNVGQGYNSSTGIFVAPASGTYLFWCHVMNENNVSLVIELHKTGSQLARGFTDLYHGFVSLTSLADLNKGEQVWFENVSGPSVIKGEGYSSYGGTLVSSYK